MIASFIWYLGLACTFLGILLVVRPIRWLGVPTRRRAAVVTLAGLALATVSTTVGGSVQRVTRPTSLLDRYFPVYQFSEDHSVVVRATPEQTYKAIFAVTPEEISFYRALTWLRCFGRSGPPSIMNPPAGQPIMQMALTSFRKLAEAPNEEIVFAGFVAAPAGALSRSWTLDSYAALEDPGFAKVAMSFRLGSAGLGDVALHTETRVYVTDRATQRIFTVYWRTIYPGSSLLRYTWLQAIKARAERASIIAPL